jgi:hypothetical protein
VIWNYYSVANIQKEGLPLFVTHICRYETTLHMWSEQIKGFLGSVNATNSSKMYVQVGVKWVGVVFKHRCAIANNKATKTMIILLIDNNLKES